MSAAILTILAALIPFLIWLWKRKAAESDDPINKRVKWREDAENEIAKDDEVGANVRINDALARFRMRKTQGNSSRPPNPSAEK